MSERLLAIALGLALAFLLHGCGNEPAPDLVTSVQAAELPDGSPAASRRYREALTGYARYTFGMDAPVPMLAGQAEQESGWATDARSPVGALGIGQFMPGTASDVARKHPELGPAQPLDPQWGLRAMVIYDNDLYGAIVAATDCDRFAFSLAGYNGGAGWVTRDKAKAKAAGLDEMRYWDSVETVNAGRSAAAFAENRGYALAIIRKRQPHYIAWGRSVCSI